MFPIIVAYDGSANAEDALAFGAFAASAYGSTLEVVCAYPVDGRAAHSYDEVMRATATDSLEKARTSVPAGVTARFVPLPATSLGKALHVYASERRAELIVLGSSAHGAAHRAIAGTLAGRLLHGSPCPVAVVPTGWAVRDGGAPRRVVVGYDIGPEGEHALATGLELAARAGCSVELVKAAPHGLAVAAEWPMFTIPERSGHEALERAARQLHEAAAGVDADVTVETAVLEGEAGQQLRQHVGAEDVLVLGSRGYGPVRSVLLGSVAKNVAASCPCPVIVVPRGAEAPASGAAVEPPVVEAER